MRHVNVQPDGTEVIYDDVNDVLRVRLKGVPLKGSNDDGYPVIVEVDADGKPGGITLIGALEILSCWSEYEATLPSTLFLAAQLWYENFQCRSR